MSRMADLHHTLTTETTTTTLVPLDVTNVPPVIAGVTTLEVSPIAAQWLAAGDRPHGTMVEVLAHIGLALQAGCSVTITTTPVDDA